MFLVTISRTEETRVNLFVTRGKKAFKSPTQCGNNASFGGNGYFKTKYDMHIIHSRNSCKSCVILYHLRLLSFTNVRVLPGIQLHFWLWSLLVDLQLCSSAHFLGIWSLMGPPGSAATVLGAQLAEA